MCSRKEFYNFTGVYCHKVKKATVQKVVIQLTVLDEKLMQHQSFEYQPENGNLGDVFNLTNWKCPEEVTLITENSFWEVKGIKMKNAWRTCKQPCHVALSRKLLHPHALSMHIIAFSKKLVIFSTPFQMHANVVLSVDTNRFFILKQRRQGASGFCM